MHLGLSDKTAKSRVLVKTVQVVTQWTGHVYAMLDSRTLTAAQVRWGIYYIIISIHLSWCVSLDPAAGNCLYVSVCKEMDQTSHC